MGLARAADQAAPLAAWEKARAAAATGKSPLTVLLLGDSNTEIFGYAGSVRLLLQSCYGSHGFGYYTLGKRMEALPGAPKIERTGTWDYFDFALDPKEKMPDKPWLAIDGLWTATADPAATLNVEGGRQYRLYYQRGPGLGSFDIVPAGAAKGVTVNCAGEQAAVGREMIAQSRWQIRNITGRVVLFGVESTNPETVGGVTVHQIGNGWAMAHHYAAMEQTAYNTMLGELRPDLITVLLGTNDMCNGWDEKGYGEQLRIVLAKLRQAAPAASILVISAPSCTFDRRALSARFNTAAQEAAAAQGCAFWSLHDFVGTNWQWWGQLEMMEYTLHYLPGGGMRVALEMLKVLGVDLYNPAQLPAVTKPSALLRDGAKPVERGPVL